VAAAWACHIASGDVRAAVALCAPTVVLHTSTGDLTGVKHVSGALESWPYAGTRLDPVDVVGEADLGTTKMTWPGWGPDRTVVAHVEHGEIVDLRIDGVPVGARETPDQLAVEVSTAGTVTDQAKQHAVAKVQHVMARVTTPVLFARVKLRHLGDPAAQRPAQAEGLLDVNGRAVRAHAAEATMTEAINELADRLGQRLLGQPHWSRAEGVPPETGEWRRDNRPSPPVAWFERPPDERQLVKRKTIADEPMTVDEAVFDMDLLDYDFYLFTELASGQDAVVSRSPNDGLELQVLHPERMEPPVTTPPVALRSAPTPTLTVEDAREWLEAGDGPMVFFADSASGRGSVLYRRYDGHYGIVTPAG
jgi:ribosome-associated translation inhibitor RaiA